MVVVVVGTIFYVGRGHHGRSLFEEIFDKMEEREREIVLLREEPIECTFVRI